MGIRWNIEQTLVIPQVPKASPLYVCMNWMTPPPPGVCSDLRYEPDLLSLNYSPCYTEAKMYHKHVEILTVFRLFINKIMHGGTKALILVFLNGEYSFSNIIICSES